MSELTGSRSAQHAPDSGLICPVCEYNLTGLPENRCPECGGEFDPDELRRMVADVAMPATPWDRQRTLRSFSDTWWLSLTAPGRMAERFPARHDAGLAVGYSFGCYGLAAIAFCILALRFVVEEQDVEAFGLLAATVFGGIFACWVCETMTAAILAVLVKPTRAHKRYHFWRGFTHYTSGFAVLTASWGGAAFLIGSGSNPFDSAALGVAYAVTAGAIYCWWVIALCKMILRRSYPGVRRWLGCIAVPVIGIVAILAGYIVTATFIFICLFP